MIDRDTLIAYLEGTLTPAERERVEQQLANDPEALRQLVEQRQLDRSLRVLLGNADEKQRVKQSILAVVRGESDETLRQQVLSSLETGPGFWQRWRDSISRVFSPRRIMWLGASTVAAVVLAAVVNWMHSPPATTHEGSTVARLEDVVGKILVERGANKLPKGTGSEINAGDVIEVGNGSMATVLYPDGRRLQLRADTKLLLDAVGGKQFELISGSIVASVTNQPGSPPMVVHTAHAVITVIGTTFTLTANLTQTRLDVQAGVVRLTRVADSSSVDVAQGQYALAMPMSKPIEVAKSTEPTTETPPTPNPIEVATSRGSTPTDSYPAGAVASATGDSAIRGKVFLRGSPPPEKSIDMGADAQCKSMHDALATTRHYVVNADGTLQNVFVYVKSGPGVEGKTFPVPEEKVLLDQKGCLYHPYVLAVRAGQKLEILNSDDTLHNVHALPKNNPEFNKGQPVKGMKSSHRFDKPEVDAPVKFKCDVHPWMFAWLFVMPHPFYDITREAGTFQLVGLPAGDYVIAAWHQKAGIQTMIVSVGANESKEVSFALEVKTTP